MCQYRAASIAQHYSVVCVPGQRSWDILYLLLRLAVNLKMLLKGKKKASEESIGRYCVLGQST